MVGRSGEALWQGLEREEESMMSQEKQLHFGFVPPPAERVR